ncbi:MAG: glycosyltransferase family 9 protein [Vicinamibacterales bacterium]
MKVLILQFRRLGDVLMTTPLLREIKAALPGAVIHVCVEEASAPAVRGNPYVDRLVAAGTGASLRLAPILRRERYDVVIDALGTPASARLALLTSAPVRIGFARRWRSACYTHRLPEPGGPRYSALDKLALIEPLGIRSDNCRIEMFPTEAERREADLAWSSLGVPAGQPVVAFSPVSRRRRKVWPAGRFAEVCDRWADRAGLRYLPLFGPGEEPMVEQVAGQLRRRGALLYPWTGVSFGALHPLMRRCVCYFGNDNGARHVAVAAGIPTAAVFGPANPASWTPPDSPLHRHAGGGGPIDAVSVGEVDALVAGLLGACGLSVRG